MYRMYCTIASAVAVASLMSGCETDPITELDANKELVRQFIAETGAQNLASYNDLWTDDVVAHFPNGVDMDRQTVEENERLFAVAFPDASRSIDQLLAEGDRVVLRETLHTQVSPLYKQPLVIHVTSFCRIIKAGLSSVQPPIGSVNEHEEYRSLVDAGD
jgi:SnoaL-like domain